MIHEGISKRIRASVVGRHVLPFRNGCGAAVGIPFLQPHLQRAFFDSSEKFTGIRLVAKRLLHRPGYVPVTANIVGTRRAQNAVDTWRRLPGQSRSFATVRISKCRGRYRSDWSPVVWSSQPACRAVYENAALNIVQGSFQALSTGGRPSSSGQLPVLRLAGRPASRVYPAPMS